MTTVLDQLDPGMLAVGDVAVSLDGDVLLIELDRPEQRNPQTPATWSALAGIGEAVRTDTQLRTVIITGRGPSFSAGLDRRMFTPEGIPGQPSLASIARESDARLDEFIQAAQAAFTWWREVRPLTIAAVRGHAVGAGFQLALACDLVVAAPDAQFAMRETSYGLVPDLAGTWPLVNTVGYPKALEMCLTGRSVTAEEAWQCGLAARISEDPVAGALELAESVRRTPAGAATDLKTLLRDAAMRTSGEQWAAERAAQSRRLRALLTGGA